MHVLEKLFAFRLRVGRIAGIPVNLHWTLLAFALFELARNLAHPRFAVLFLLVLFGSVLLHELGHCWGARKVGGHADEILLWPLGGLAMIHAPQQPWPQFFSTATGPLVNLLLTAVALPPFLFAGGELGWLLPWAALGPMGTGLLILFLVVEINLVLFLFNLVPAFPMDGGRLLHTALWPRLGFESALRVAIYAAFVSAAGMVVFALTTQARFVGVIGFLVALYAWRELIQLRYGLHGPEPEPWAASLYAPDPAEARPSRFARWREERRRRREAAARERREAMRARMDEILAKVSDGGLDALTKEERRFLDYASAELRKEQQQH